MGGSHSHHGDQKKETTHNINAEALKVLRGFIIDPHVYSLQAKQLGLIWPNGLLLHGHPGQAKVSLVNDVVDECNACIIFISSSILCRKSSLESENLLREAFYQAHAHASSGKPSVILIEEIDLFSSICDYREMESLVLTQLIILIDCLQTTWHPCANIAIVATTNRLHEVHPSLREYERFGYEVEVKEIEDKLESLEVFRSHTDEKVAATS